MVVHHCRGRGKDEVLFETLDTRMTPWILTHIPLLSQILKVCISWGLRMTHGEGSSQHGGKGGVPRDNASLNHKVFNNDGMSQIGTVIGNMVVDVSDPAISDPIIENLASFFIISSSKSPKAA